MGRLGRGTFVGLLIWAMVGVLSLSSPGKDEVAVTLKDKVIRDLSSSGLTLAFRLEMANPATAPRSLVRYRYRVTVRQKEFLNMEVRLDEPLVCEAGRSMLVALPVRITYEHLQAAVGPIEGRAVCDVVGEMVFLNERKREQRVPFAFSGEFPIFRDPEVEILPLVVKDLTVGGADVVFRSLFRNLNDYDLLVDAIRFELSFGDRRVLSGDIPGDKSLPRSGEKVFALPFLVDFFEAGEETREAFSRDGFPCRFAGTIEIASVWGRLVVPFERAQALRLERAPGR